MCITNSQKHLTKTPLSSSLLINWDYQPKNYIKPNDRLATQRKHQSNHALKNKTPTEKIYIPTRRPGKSPRIRYPPSRTHERPNERVRHGETGEDGDVEVNKLEEIWMIG